MNPEFRFGLQNSTILAQLKIYIFMFSKMIRNFFKGKTRKEVKSFDFYLMIIDCVSSYRRMFGKGK